MARTKDEMFMLRLHEEALKQQNLEDPLDRYVIGRLAGLHDKGIDTICNTLAQTNFIKKRGDNLISITPNGVRLVQMIKGQA